MDSMLVNDTQNKNRQSIRRCISSSHREFGCTSRSRYALVLIASLTCLLPSVSAQNPITPPPRLNQGPVIANGRIYYLDHIPTRCQPPIIDTFPGGQLIKDNRAMVKADNPHIVKGNIEIAPSGCLYIEPGTEIRFGPGVGMIINGTLIARGSELPGGRITMTKAEGDDLQQASGDWQDDARLVLGNTTRDGRLDLSFKGKWRAVCTNYNNFTAIDANVTCRHLGFLKGNFTYHSYARNETDYILWEKPDCRGEENSLFECPGAVDNNMRTGMHICDGQQVIGFECEGLRPGLAIDHWRGLDFYNSTTEARYQMQDNRRVYIEESLSFLEYLDISYTGLDSQHGQTSEIGIFYPKAAISASPHVPMINNVTVRYGAYDAFNMTEIVGPIHVANSTVSHNRGHGMYIQTSIGRTLINMTEVAHNWGDGIKWYLSNLTIFDFRTKFPPEEAMCVTGDTRGQVFPIYEHLDLIQVNGNNRDKAFVGDFCDRTFITDNDMRITIHFLIMERDPAASGRFILRDGGKDGPVLNTVELNNGSFPESITTETSTLFVSFQFEYPRDSVCKQFPSCIRFLIELTSDYDVEEEFRLWMSSVHNNVGHGVNIHDMRSKVRISNETEISNNGFGAGVKVYRGAGQVVVNGTRIEGNQDAGINITYSGGFQLINQTQVVGNKGYGIITEYLKLNRTRIESQHVLQVVKSLFDANEFIGLRVGNYCMGGHVTINETNFNNGLDDAFEYLSCNITTSANTRLDMKFNIFNGNHRHAIILRPLLNTEGTFSSNRFYNQTFGSILIDNGYDLLLSRWYRQFPVKMVLEDNIFMENGGRYVVNFRLTQYSSLQSLTAKYNYFQENQIQEAFQPYLRPRSRASAVIVLSSSNVVFRRNFLKNPSSIREVATHLVDPSIVLDASQNYWDLSINAMEDYQHVFESIFDQNSRHNLAIVEYHPALRTLDLRASDSMLSTSIPKYQWQFARGDTLGGALLHGLSTYVVQSDKVYYVDRDIYIYPNKTLHLDPGSTLKFAPSVGMVVHGLLRADGSSVFPGQLPKPVTFTLDDRETWVPIENRTTNVRLQDGDSELEGRLEVDLGDGIWGTVCNDGWIEENAILACQQLGLVYSKDSPQPYIRRSAPGGTPVVMSWVSCEHDDLDITQCRAINGDAENCGHEKDVFLKCHRPTWAGVTLAAAYWHDQNQGQRTDSQLRYVNIKQAGMMDSDTATLAPSLRIDYNYYQISYIKVENALSDGIHVFYHHPYSISKMEYLTVSNCLGNGVVTRSPRLEVMHSEIRSNLKAGFLYDPFFTEYDALLVRNMIYPARRLDMFALSQRQFTGDEMMFLICSAGTEVETNQAHTVEIKSYSYNYRLVVQVLDYLPVETAEKVIIFDSAPSQTASAKYWEIEKDLVDFPIVSSYTSLTIRLVVNGQRSGRLALAVTQIVSTASPPYLHTALTNTSFIGNDQGVVTKHYNSPSNKRLELFHRHKEESFEFRRLNISYSARHAMHMPSVTKFHEDYIPTYEDMTQSERLARISYSMELIEFHYNNIGLLAEHNHVDFSNNVWQWTISELIVKDNREGGVEIEMPRVNEDDFGNGDTDTRKIHKVKVTKSQFIGNEEFAFTVAGYHAEIHVESDTFTDNVCRMGLIAILGMEKELVISSNIIQRNDGRFAVDIDIDSHYEYFGEVHGSINYNTITDNRYTGPTPPGAPYSPRTFAVAVKGLQNMKGSQNIFINPDLDYEFVAGIITLTFGNPMDVTQNYWGVTDELSIRRRIFDFDDWNNYVIAQYFPYLTEPKVNSNPSTGVSQKYELDPFHLGGRVDESRVLEETGRPYVVESDLTILPGITLTIPAGAELHFRPNVGILVLGRLIANGLPYARIKFKPIPPSSTDALPQTSYPSDTVTSRKRRNSEEDLGVRLRGTGTLFENAGFLELYNTSTGTWNLMCDSQFNDKTAEVVCRALGLETINVYVRFTHLYDHYIYGKPMYFLKEFWFNSYHCRGDETSLHQCITRYNYKLQSCIQASNYTFITCGKRNLDSQLNYWGNLRFAEDSYEEKPLEDDIGRQRSSLSYIDIEGAGMLHGEKVGAIQTTYVTPEFNNINITACADNGYDIIAPRQDLNIELQNISGNLGYGVNVLVLNGESREQQSSFLPNSPSTLPYQVHGLVDMCRLEKEIQVETRAVLFYKYGPLSRDCVKIIRSSRNVGLRLLQVHLLHDDFSRNTIEIYEGSEVSESNLLGRVMSNSTGSTTGELYRTQGAVMSVHVHASVGHESYGFIAEVVRLPLSGTTYPDSTISHSLQHAEIRYNQHGALRYKNVGEMTPSVYVEHCWLGDNGHPILNLTSPPTISISLQSTIKFRFSHNQVSKNSGGMYIFSHTAAMIAALRGNITNNVFAFGVNGEALNISGHYFQSLMFHQNYIYNYTAGDYRDVIHVKDVVVNLTHNYILRNIGHYIIHTYNSEDGTKSQIFNRNGIYDNNATALRESTIKIGVGYPSFSNNYLVNNLNDFEMETYPKTRLGAEPIMAQNNWWGSEREAYINGKTYDYSDDPLLEEVSFMPPILDQRAVVEGDCLPGWSMFKNRCYRYMGGALPFEDAKEFCKSHGAFLAESRGREDYFNLLIRLMVIERDWAQKVWVMSDLGAGRCPAFEYNYIVYEEDCTRRYYPFICETDPELLPPEELKDAIKAMILGICLGVGLVILIVAAILLVLWFLKSRRREKARLERTASIRSSMNNLNKINGSLRGTKSTLSMTSSVGASRRRLAELDQKSVDSSVTPKHSHRDSYISNGTSVHSVHSLSSGLDVTDNRDTRAERPAVSTAPVSGTGARPRQVHSLRPDRSAAGWRAQIQAGSGSATASTLPPTRPGDRGGRRVEEEAAESRARWQPNRDRTRRRGEPPVPAESEGEEEERGKYADSSDDGSVDKEDFSDDDDYIDSTFDRDYVNENSRGNEEEVDAKNMQYHINRSNERLIDRPWETPVHPPVRQPGPLPSQVSVDSDTSEYIPNPHKSKSLSSFLDNDYSASHRALLPPLSASRENLPSPPPNPSQLRSSPALNRPGFDSRPTPRPKPVPPARQTPPVYNNVPRVPIYDPVYEGEGRMRSPYDPVYEPSNPSDQSQSTNRYEPLDFGPENTPPVQNYYGFDQAPDTDYLPRPSNSNLARSRLGAPPPAPPPHRGMPLESDIDNYLSDCAGGAAAAPKKAPSSIYSDSSASSRSRYEPLPPKPGAPRTPLGAPVSYNSPYNKPYQGSRENLNNSRPQIPQPPPYSTVPRHGNNTSRSAASSRHGSQETNLDQLGNELPPPYSPGDRAQGHHGSRSDVLYLGQGARPKLNESIETEI